jgi:hypothetical protein
MRLLRVQRVLRTIDAARDVDDTGFDSHDLDRRKAAAIS